MGIDLGALGDLVIELGVDIAPLQSDLDQGASAAQQGADKISDAIGSATAGTDKLQQGLDNVTESLDALGKDAKDNDSFTFVIDTSQPQQDLIDLQKELDTLVENINSANVATESFGSEAASASTGTQQLDGQAAALSTQMTDVQTNTDKATESIGALTPATQKSSGAMKEGSESAGEIKDTIFELAAEVGVATGAFEILKESLESFSKAQDIQTSFTLLSGSADTAKESFEGLKTTATNLAVPFSDLLSTAQKLAPQFGVGTAELNSALTAAADAAAATGRSFDTVSSGLDRIAISGQVTTRQLVQFGVSISDIATNMGVSVTEAEALLKKGGQDAQSDVDAVIGAIETKFGGAAETIAQNLSGQFTNLKNQLDFVAEDLGTALAPAASALLSAFSAVLPVIDSLVTSVGSIYSGSVKENIDALVELFGSLKGAASDLKTAMDGIASSLAAILPPSLVADLKSLGEAVAASTAGFKVWVPGLSDATTALNALAAGVELVTGKIPAMDKAASDLAAKLQASVNSSLHDSAVELGGFGDATKKATDNTALLQIQLAAAQKDIKKYAELQQEGFDVTNQLADAQQKVVDIQAKLNPSLKLIIDEASLYIDKGTQIVSVVGDMNDINAQQVTQWTDTRTALDNVTDSTELAAAQVRFFSQDMEGLLTWANELPTSLDKQTTSVQKLAGAMGKDFIKSLTDAEAGQQALDKEYKDSGVPNADALSAALARNQQAYQDLKDKGLVTTYGEMVHDQETLKDQITQQTNLGTNTDDLQLKYVHLTAQLATVKTGFTDTATAITAAIGTDTQKAVDDLITGVGNLGDDFKKMGEDVVDIFVNRIIKDAMKPLLDALDSVIDKALQAAEDVLGIGKGSSIPGIGGSSTPSGGDGIPGVDGQPGIDTGAGGGSSAGDAAGSIAGGLSGIVTAISSVATAVSSIVQNFQLAHIETTLQDIEAHDKVIAIATLGISDVSEKNQQGGETTFAFTKRIADSNDSIYGYLLNSVSLFYNAFSPTFASMAADLAVIAAGSIASNLGGDAGTAAAQIALLNAATVAAMATVAADFNDLKLSVYGSAAQLALSVGNSIKDQTDEIKQMLTTLAESIDKSLNPLGKIGEILGAIGGGLGGITGGIGQAAGGIGGGLLSGLTSLFDGQSGSLKDIESHTKVIAIATLGISDVSEKNQQGNETMFYFTKHTADNTDILVNGALAQTNANALIYGALTAIYDFNLNWIYPRIADILAALTSDSNQQTITVQVNLDGQQMASAFTTTLEQMGVKSPAY